MTDAPETTWTAGELAGSRRCSPQCLLALDKTCTCRCRSRWHGALVSAEPGSPAPGVTVSASYQDDVRTFSHNRLAQLPAYTVLRQALSDLCNEAAPARLGGFLADLRDMALTAPYGDTCPRCKDRHVLCWPHQVTRDGDRIRGTYRCDRGHTWTCGYVVAMAWMMPGI